MTSTSKSTPRRIDPIWIFAGIILIVALLTAIIANHSNNNDISTKIEGTVETDNGDLKINWERYQTIDVELADTYTISESGTYHFTGTLSSGAIVIDSGVSEVRLILDNVTINNPSGPAIVCYSAEDLVIELVGDNTISDGSSYSTDYDEDVTGAIYSKSDLAFQGEGTLSITGNYQDGIVGKDDVKFNSGTYSITATDDGIRGKDSVYIVAGDYTINSGADAIKVTNDIDANKGFIMIESGDFDIAAGAKGLESVSSILIYNGSYIISSYDDAIHSNNYVGIINGDINVNSGDDGIHADKEFIMDGGNIVIAKSYEGIEAQAITINGGELSVVSSDDGLNTGGGADNSANNRQGAGAFDVNTDCVLSINGGKIYINASGDGIDSNGYLYFNGGSTVVDGPTNNGNGALDAGAGIAMSGGSVIAIGSSGMAETLGTNSTVYSASIYLGSAQSANTLIEIKDSADNTIVNHTSAKAFSHIAVGTTEFIPGETYTIYLNGEKYDSFTISSTVTTVGNNNVNQQMMPGRR